VNGGKLSRTDHEFKFSKRAFQNNECVCFINFVKSFWLVLNIVFFHTQTNFFLADGNHPIFSEATGIDGLLRNNVKIDEQTVSGQKKGFGPLSEVCNYFDVDFPISSLTWIDEWIVVTDNFHSWILIDRSTMKCDYDKASDFIGLIKSRFYLKPTSF